MGSELVSDAAIKRPPAGMPTPVLLSAAALIVLTLAGAATARLTGIGKAPSLEASPVQSLALRFRDESNGSVLVLNASDGAVIHTIAPESDGFMRATLRGLAQERRRSGIGDATPFHLTQWSDGRMSLDDPTTGRDVALEAFGETNATAFAQLFASGEKK
jgi:putative photosynthetic complex assembly protein